MADEWDQYAEPEVDEWEQYALPAETPEESSFFGDVAASASKRAGDIAEEWSAPSEPDMLGFMGGGKALRTAGQAAGFLNDVAFAGLRSAYRAMVPQAAQEAISSGVESFVEQPFVKEGIEGVSELYGAAKESYPEGMGNLEAVANIAGAVPVVKGAMAAGRGGLDIGADIYSMATRKTPEAIESALDKAISKGIEKGIRPTVAGKGNIGQIEAYKERAKTAVKDIIENKESLALTDAEGEIIKGALPKSLVQFSEAIDQTKKGIFRQYDDLAKAAGEQGAKVDLAPVVKELEGVAGQTTLQDLHPEIARYAETRMATLAKRGTYSTEEAQDAITQLNKSLESFYRNPSYEHAQKAGVDALIANNLRNSLDSVIENATGGGYQALKNSYGSLKTIEKEVAHRAVVDARRNIKGLVDFTDIYTSGELVAGVLTMNPGMMVKGLTWKAVQQYIKAMNNPNRIVKNMFSEAEKLLNKKPPTMKSRPFGPTGPLEGPPPF